MVAWCLEGYPGSLSGPVESDVELVEREWVLFFVVVEDVWGRVEVESALECQCLAFSSSCEPDVVYHEVRVGGNWFGSMVDKRGWIEGKDAATMRRLVSSAAKAAAGGLSKMGSCELMMSRSVWSLTIEIMQTLPETC
jgi:hypothetical protein